MKKIRLIGLDLDGTLLDNGKRISDRTYQAMQEAAKRGVYLVPVTGRPHGGIPELVRNLPFVRYFISCNGASIRDGKRQCALREKLIPPDESQYLTEVLNRHRMPYEVLWNGYGYSEQWVYDHWIARSPNKGFLTTYIRETRKIVPHLPSFIAEENKGLEEVFILTQQREMQEELLRELQGLPNLNIVFPSSVSMEITAGDVDKGEALLFLAESLGIAQHEVMAMGDSGNDLAMLRAAGFPVAMGNAVQEVKEMAKFTTASNEEHGVALAIERYVL